MPDERSKYTDPLLDEKFTSIDRRLGDLRDLPRSFAALAAAVEGLTREVAQLRNDAHEDMSILRDDTRQTSRVLLGFLSALLVAMVGAIVSVMILL